MKDDAKKIETLKNKYHGQLLAIKKDFNIKICTCVIYIYMYIHIVFEKSTQLWILYATTSTACINKFQSVE